MRKETVIQIRNTFLFRFCKRLIYHRHNHKGNYEKFVCRTKERFSYLPGVIKIPILIKVSPKLALLMKNKFDKRCCY